MTWQHFPGRNGPNDVDQATRTTLKSQCEVVRNIKTMAESSSGEESSPRNSGSSQGYLADHVVILYASETGNAQDTAERVGREYRRLGRRCVVISMDMFDIVRDLAT